MAQASKKIADIAGKARLAEHSQTFRSRVWPGLEKFIIAGPTLIGFALGLMNYAPGQKHFEVAFQSLCLFAGYIVSLVIVQILDSLFFSPWPIVLGVTRSLLALAYLGLTLKQYFDWRSRDVKPYGAVEKIRTSLSTMIGHAG